MVILTAVIYIQLLVSGWSPTETGKRNNGSRKKESTWQVQIEVSIAYTKWGTFL